MPACPPQILEAADEKANVPEPFANRSRADQRDLDVIIAHHTHLSLDKDTPEPRPVQSTELGRLVAIPQLGGLHHRYERRAA